MKGVKGKAIRFKSDYDKISIDKEIPSFEWTDQFSTAIWINTEQQKENARQYILIHHITLISNSLNVVNNIII